MAVEFDLPDGFQTPEDVQPGGTFDAVASLKMGDDGSVTLVAVDGIPLAGVDKGPDQDQMPQQSTPGPTPSTGADQTGQSFLHAMG